MSRFEGSFPTDAEIRRIERQAQRARAKALSNGLRSVSNFIGSRFL